MAPTSRVTMQPVNFNAGALGTAMATIPGAYSTPGVDAAGTGGTSFATAWPGTSAGVQFQNSGSMILMVWSGTTAGVIAYNLIGQKAGGQVEPYTTYSSTVAASSVGWLGPWSVGQFTQQDGAQFATGNGGAAPGGQINASTPSGVGMTCIDFNTTTTLAVRLYQLIPAIP
jgi:hypothetical protein